MHARLPSDSALSPGGRIPSLKGWQSWAVVFAPNSFQVINPLKIYRVDLCTNDGYEYRIDRQPATLRPGTYTMCKCYEMIGFSDEDIEWAYLMAGHDW